MAEETAPPLPADREDLEPKVKNGRRPGDPYEVGYGRPPKASRWKKGQSGHPPGRPPKPPPTLYEILERVLQQKVPVTRDGKRVRLTRDEIRLKALLQKSMAGDVAATIELEKQKKAHPAPSPELGGPDHSSAKRRLAELLPHLVGKQDVDGGADD